MGSSTDALSVQFVDYIKRLAFQPLFRLLPEILTAKPRNAALHQSALRFLIRSDFSAHNSSFESGARRFEQSPEEHERDRAKIQARSGHPACAGISRSGPILIPNLICCFQWILQRI
jgi:hypothetical protein